MTSGRVQTIQFTQNVRHILTSWANVSSSKGLAFINFVILRKIQEALTITSLCNMTDNHRGNFRLQTPFEPCISAVN